LKLLFETTFSETIALETTFSETIVRKTTLSEIIVRKATLSETIVRKAYITFETIVRKATLSETIVRKTRLSESPARMQRFQSSLRRFREEGSDAGGGCDHDCDCCETKVWDRCSDCESVLAEKKLQKTLASFRSSSFFHI
jgi:hypothetical protein